MRTTGTGFFFIAPVRVRVEVISYTCRLLIFKSVASSSTVKISIASTLATPRTPLAPVEIVNSSLHQGRHRIFSWRLPRIEILNP